LAGHEGEGLAVAADGQAGLEVAQKTLPDVVISDVTMPRLDGLQLTRALRDNPALDGVAIILLTARGSSTATVTGLEHGADVYLTKPFSSKVLRAHVDQQLTQRQRQRLRNRQVQPHSPPANDAPDSADANFQAALTQVICEHLADPTFNIELLASRMGQDRTTLFRRVKAVTGEAPSAFLRQMRLEHAARIIDSQVGTISEVAYASGFNSVSHFSRAFKGEFRGPQSRRAL
jgi:DNA-binding response OmpR family regulator